MKARQKGKQNKKFEFIFQTEKDIQDIMREAKKILSQRWLQELTSQAQEWKMYEMDYEMQHILNDNLSNIYEE